MKLVQFLKRPFKWLYSRYFYIRNRHIDYFDIHRLAKDVYPYAWPEVSGVIGSTCYGNKDVLKAALGTSFHDRCMIEHGLYFAEYVLEEECNLPCIDTIYTYSDYRKQSILKWFDGKLDKDIITVGPYIQYACNFKKSAELKALKQKYKRILLVFPYHGFPGEEIRYDISGFQQAIDEMAANYDSVFISMNGFDVANGNDKPYRDKGYHIVSSGSRFDPYFLSRQRDLIELSDMTMSNAVGTHIGYCVCLNRPHYIYNQKIHSSGLFETNINSDIRAKEEAELKNAFSSREEKITSKQVAIVRYYWGDFKILDM